MLNKPEKFSSKDLEKYKHLIELVDLIDNPRQIGAGHYKRTGKYAFLSKLLNLEKDSQNTKNEN